MNAPTLPDKVVALDGALASARIPHAFGGALALAYYAEPRTTYDIDINLFVGVEQGNSVRDALEPVGVMAGDLAQLERDGQCRWWWERTPVDLFFAYDPLHDAMRDSIRRVPFGEDRIPILSPEHLTVCKAMFDRAKDWLDIEQILVSNPDLDRDQIRDWLTRMMGQDDERLTRFDELAGRG